MFQAGTQSSRLQHRRNPVVFANRIALETEVGTVKQRGTRPKRCFLLRAREAHGPRGDSRYGFRETIRPFRPASCRFGMATRAAQRS